MALLNRSVLDLPEALVTRWLLEFACLISMSVTFLIASTARPTDFREDSEHLQDDQDETYEEDKDDFIDAFF